MVKVFFSYSREDEALRAALETHLAPLKRDGAINTWHDQRIAPGDELHVAISSQLETADIILFLVSADFLASDYCCDVEVPKAMERHQRGEVRVIPVILRPCDWTTAPFRHLKAVPKDGTPVTDFPKADDAFLQVAKAVRMAATELEKQPRQQHDTAPASPSTAATPSLVPTPRSPNLHIKHQFTDHDRHTFLQESFDYIADYFEGSLTELKKRHPEVQASFRRIDANRFTAVAYVHGAEASRCVVQLGSTAFARSITYSYGHLGDGSYNESLDVADDGHILFLKPLGMLFGTSQSKERLSKHKGAEFLWTMFMDRLQQ